MSTPIYNTISYCKSTQHYLQYFMLTITQNEFQKQNSMKILHEKFVYKFLSLCFDFSLVNYKFCLPAFQTHKVHTTYNI